MLNWFDNWLNKITMYKLMQYYLRLLVLVAVVLSFFHILPYTWWHIVTTMLYLIAICWISNRIFAWFFKITPNYESAFITALILTLIITPVNPLSSILFLTVLGIASQASKYLVAIKERHIFNPAAFAVVFTAITLGEGASWWIGSAPLFPFVAIGGLVMIYKLGWFHLVAAFLIPYLVFTSVENLKIVLTSSPILFFSFVMLVEPLTSPPGKNKRIYYGIFTAVVLVIYQTLFSNIPYSLELALLTGNVFAYLVNPVSSLVLRLKEKTEVAAHTLNFTFIPNRPLSFQPGQFLFYSFPHPHADSRGSRRYFTIASSPTEDHIMLATRMAEKASSFKQQLVVMNPSDQIKILGLEGEFTLPADPKVPLVFIAGGIGITPFRSMIKYLWDKNEKRPVTLIYSNKTEQDITFKDLFDQAAQILELKIVYVITEKTGYINAKLITQEVPNYPERLFYISGPDPFVRSMKKMLLGMNIKRHQIKTDYFPGY